MAILAMSGLNAQVVNRAISLEKDGSVNCGQMPKLDNLSSYSVQLWLNPDNWSEGATLISRGDGFSVKLGAAGSVVLNVGQNSVAASSTDLKAGEWNQVTFINQDGNVTAMVNGTESGKGSLGSIAASTDKFVLGGNYEGLLDEVRVWNDALNDKMKMFDYFTNNTLNKWCPMWDNLIAYYKMDQENCPYLVDYRALENKDAGYDNHGILSSGVKKVVAANDKMPYLLNAGYCSNERFFDRLVPPDQYLLSNEIIIIGADCVPTTGGIKLRTPNNHAEVSGVKYLSSLEGRDGVAEFNGAAKLTLPAAALAPSDSYSFESWVYLDEWTPGAYLLQKESSDKSKGIAILLGDNADSPTVKVRINGAEFQSFKLDIPMKEWFHFALEPAIQPSGVAQTFNFYVNGTSKNVNKSSSPNATTDNVPAGNENEPVYIGEGLKGKLDETCLWKKIWGNNIKAHMNYIPLPALDRNVAVSDMQNTISYLRYDNPENLGFSSHSQDNWAKIIRSAYDGYAGSHVVLSVTGSAGSATDFYAIINNADKRKAFAKALADLSGPYDGVELDLEWVYNATGQSSWANYALMSDEIKAALPEGKTFRVSMHNVTYQYPKDKVDNVDGFTIQQYGPQNYHFTFTQFKNSLNSMKNWGLPASKLVTSYATTTSKGYLNGSADTPIQGVKDGYLTDYVASEDESESALTSLTKGGYTYSYMTPMQVYRRAKYTRENGFQGIFYWDMGNDLWDGTMAAPVHNPNNMATYCSYGLNANCDPIVTNLTVNHIGESGVDEIISDKQESKGVVVTPSPADSEISVYLTNGELPVEVKIYSLAGALVKDTKQSNGIKVDNLVSGVYMVTAKDSKGKLRKTKFVKR